MSVIVRTLLCAALATLGSGALANVRHHPRHGRQARAATARRHAVVRTGAAYGHAARPYGYGYDLTPNCRYADGTPFDPDIIGGPNHVGDGGPADNLGGFDPCGF